MGLATTPAQAPAAEPAARVTGRVARHRADHDELLDVLELIGAHLAEVRVDDLATWAAITPALAALTQSLRRLCVHRDGADRDGRGRVDLAPVPQAAPPVVRVREFGILATALAYPPGQGGARTGTDATMDPPLMTDPLATTDTLTLARTLRRRLAEASEPAW